MKKYRLTIVTENQKTLDKATRVGGLICSVLNLANKFEVTKYEKFQNSYRLEFAGHIESGLDSIKESIDLTDRIVSSWTVRYHKDENEIGLTFNKSDSSDFRKQEFNVIKWGNFEIE